jgi:photosynthetic reaction center cytochrome c subunit
MHAGARQVTGIAAAFFMAGAMARSQAPAEKPLMAEQVFKNVKVLKGIPVGEFMDTMGFFAASLGLNCVYCHVAESMENWDKFAEDVPRKETARAMILMVNAINKGSFGGRRALTCYSCHRGAEHPKVVPSLADQYTVPVEDPNEIEIVKDAPPGPSADQILDKYIQALGGAQQLASFTSFAGKGTYEGYDTYHVKVPLEIYAKAPGQRTIIGHTQNGDSTTTYDGRAGWVAAVDKPVHLLALLPGSELDGAKLDADLCFPAGIKQALAQWQNGFPVTTIEDREVQVIQGIAGGGSRVKLYFDSKTGLLARQLRYTNTMVGTIPIQIDYSDYREIAGIKIPFHWVVTWTGGQSTMELNEVQANVPIDAARFSKPAPAVVTKAVAR